MQLEAILSAFEEALELEDELGTRTVEIDRALLRPLSSESSASIGVPVVPDASGSPAAVKGAEAPAGPGATEAAKPVADFAFLLECDPAGPVAELLPRMSEAIGYGSDGVRINDPNARVLIVLGADALRKWLPGVLARPGQWVKRGKTPALVTASPTKTYRFYGHDPAKIRQLKLRLWADLKAALASIGKGPPPRQKGKQ